MLMGLAVHENFVDIRSGWIDVRSCTRRCAKRRDTEGVPAGNRPGLRETFDDAS